MVVDDGVAVTGVPVEELKLDAGLHVYDMAPEAVSVALFPEHIEPEAEEETETVGVGFTVTLIVAVLLHPPASVPVTV